MKRESESRESVNSQHSTVHHSHTVSKRERERVFNETEAAKELAAQPIVMRVDARVPITSSHRMVTENRVTFNQHSIYLVYNYFQMVLITLDFGRRTKPMALADFVLKMELIMKEFTLEI